MRAVLLTGFGGTDRLILRHDVPLPTPVAGEVLVRVGACGINNTDIWTREGAYGADTPSGWQEGAFEFPRIQGADPVGRVVGLGAGVPSDRMNQRVMINPTIYGAGSHGLLTATYLGSERDGGFAEFVTVPADNAHPIDSALSDAELATFMTSYLTAEHMLDAVALAAGERLLVTGASGGVGSALIQLARLRGAEVAAVAGRHKLDAVAALGAQAVVARDEVDWRQELDRQGFGRGVDAVADIVAGSQVATCLECLRPGGRYVTAGAIGGPRVTLDWRMVYLRQLTLTGVTMGSQEQARRIVAHVQSGRLKPLLAGSYPLEALPQAQHEFCSRQHVGKLVITL